VTPRWSDGSGLEPFAGEPELDVLIPTAGRPAGEDVAAQWCVTERSGGAGIIRSGAVHLEAPTTVADRGTDAAREVLGQ